MNPDPAIARECVEASLRSYSAQTVSSPLAHALLVEGNARDVLAFRGSQNERDWITDFEFPINDLGFHEGFFAAWQSISAPVFDLVMKRDPRKPLAIGGHSLGGALAVLCAEALAIRDIPFDALHTFGQPRVGNARAAAVCRKCFGDRHTRWVYKNDIVPRVPGLALGFRHSGNAEFFSSFGGLIPSPSLALLAASDFFGFFVEWSAQKRIALLADHSIINYVSALSFS